MYKIILTTAALLTVSFSALAQAPETKKSSAAVSATDTAAAAENPAEVQPQPAPTEITPEQKIAARRELQKSIQTTAVNSSPKEREKLIDAVETLKKIKIRQENLKKEPGEEINYQAPDVNVKDRKAVQNYLQETFVAPLDASFATPDQEQK